MSVLNTYSRSARDPFWTPERIDRIVSWYNRPLTPRGECVTAAVVGSVTFILFVIAAALGA